MSDIDWDYEWDMDRLKLHRVVMPEHYDVLQNANGDILISMEHTKSPVTEFDGVYLYYDGGRHALLHKNWDIVVIWSNLHTEIRKPLADAPKILVTEVMSGNVMEEYEAEVLYEAGIEKLVDEFIQGGQNNG